jgi:hypothetical protein
MIASPPKEFSKINACTSALTINWFCYFIHYVPVFAILLLYFCPIFVNVIVSFSLPPTKQGVIHDGAANYSKDITCSWLLDAQQNNMRIRFIINDFATECIWDHFYVHDGDSAFAPLVSVIRYF